MNLRVPPCGTDSQNGMLRTFGLKEGEDSDDAHSAYRGLPVHPGEGLKDAAAQGHGTRARR